MVLLKSFSILLGALLSIMFLIGCQQSTGADTTTIAVDNPESPYPREGRLEMGMLLIFLVKLPTWISLKNLSRISKPELKMKSALHCIR